MLSFWRKEVWPSKFNLSFCVLELDARTIGLVSFTDLTLLSSTSEAFVAATMLGTDEERVLIFLLYRVSLEGDS